eukprot:TRINITY_DN3716_c0_g1_i13.p1 TRINITY_DN3716_c0_g1~~TRINITY_DN3716_c0_g1_i13.p1  ORF type:complete len:161 (+),score=9.86 TRINITY_DN3716_c0_g1_i13:208-690(+)
MDNEHLSHSSSDSQAENQANKAILDHLKSVSGTKRDFRQRRGGILTPVEELQEILTKANAEEAVIEVNDQHVQRMTTTSIQRKYRLSIEWRPSNGLSRTQFSYHIVAQIHHPKLGICVIPHFLMKTTQLLSLIHISEPTRRTPISYAVFCLKKKNTSLIR